MDDLAKYGLLDIPMNDKAGIAFLDEQVKFRDARIAELEAALATTPEARENGWEGLRREYGEHLDGWEPSGTHADAYVDGWNDALAAAQGEPDWQQLYEDESARYARRFNEEAARGEPHEPLDVDRLGKAIWAQGPIYPRDQFFTETVKDIAAEYLRLATPATPEPDQ